MSVPLSPGAVPADHGILEGVGSEREGTALQEVEAKGPSDQKVRPFLLC